MFVHEEVAGMNPADMCARMCVYVHVCVLRWETDGCRRVINTPCVCVCLRLGSHGNSPKFAKVFWCFPLRVGIFMSVW